MKLAAGGLDRGAKPNACICNSQDLAQKHCDNCAKLNVPVKDGLVMSVRLCLQFNWR